MVKKLLSFFKDKPIEEEARESFEKRHSYDRLSKDADGNYLNASMQTAWNEFLDDYVKSTWW